MQWLLIIGVITAMYMAFNIAANDIGNSMGTVVGSGALTMRKALIVGALFEFLGAIFLGSSVIKTVGSGIVPLEFMTGLGAFIITLSAGIWITITLIQKIPISGSDAIVSSVLGYGIVYAGFHNLNWITVGYIMAGWVISPLIGLASGFLVYYLLKMGLLKRIKNNIGAKDRAEKVFSYFQIGSSSFAALGVGAIDIAAATAVLYVTVGSSVGFSIKFLGAIALVFGILIAGNRITNTIGRRITELVPTRGFSAQISAGSITLLFASIGLPISPTQTLVGSVIGVGMARGTDTVKLDVIKHIATTWIITIPACIAISASLYLIINAFISNLI
ncbi:MAG: inorganic phosphate transporter [Methanobacterium sp.]